MFYLSCPSLIKLVDNYSDFCAQKLDEFKLSEDAATLGKKSSIKLTEALRAGAIEASGKSIDDGDFITLTLGHNNSINLEREQLSNAFWIIQDHLARSSLFFRVICTVFFSVGFLLLASIFFRNIMLVAKYAIQL